MTDNQKISSLEEAKAYIYSINFSQIIDKMIKKDKWKRSEAETLCQYYRNFLYLTKKYNQEDAQLPPSDEIDEFWHNHILDTEKYIKDCNAIFGRYLQHYPYFGIDDKSNMQDLQKAFDNMQRLYKQEFGDCVYRVRALSIFDVFKTSMQIIKEFFTGTSKK